jgi:geranylgeranyl diphosphate synthase type I
VEFIKEQREKVLAYLDVFLEEKRRDFSRVNFWGDDAVLRLMPFITSGKMLRSGFVCLGYTMCGRKVSPAIIPAAAAVEFLQAALLIHDDIIDRDNFRRGLPSLFYQYAQRGKEEGFSDPTHFGEGMGICLGDIAFFLAFELFSDLKCPKSVKEEIIRLWSRELCYVGLAQMQDLYFGETSQKIAARDILKLFHYKTARYSFSVPLKTGAMLGGAKPSLLSGLEKCGHGLGLLFQLKDDELGLYGTEEEIGKPVGSDLRECKKTLHYYYLSERASAEDRARFDIICGNEDLSLDMVQEVRTMMAKYDVDSIVHQKMDDLAVQVQQEIAGLDIPANSRAILNELLEYSLKRRK